MILFYVLTNRNKRKKRMIVTQNINECFDFIIRNPDAKIKYMGWDETPKIVSKRNFILRFNSITKDIIKTIKLVDILVEGSTNIHTLTNKMGIKDEMEKYLEIKNRTL